MAPTLPYTVVDAFTSAPFKGNPAAVIVLPSPLPDATLQSIAAEFNLSETAFITPIDSASGKFGLRWFTPTLEVALCGHATLASAHVLFSSSGILPGSVNVIEFQTNVSGILTAKRLNGGKIELEFPAGEPTAVSPERDELVRKAINELFSNAENLVVKSVVTGTGVTYSDYLIVEVNEDFGLETALASDFEALISLAPESKVIIVTQCSSSGKEFFKSRVFGPAVGIPEDPVTGSAHSILGPYWAKRLPNAPENMLARQVSKRTGDIGVVVDEKRNVVRLQGNAVAVAKGELFLPA